MKHLIRVVTILLIFSTSAFAQEGKINWKITWDGAVKAATESSRPILMLFTNPRRCPPCRQLEASTLKNADVVAFINDKFVPLLLVTNTKESQALAMEFNIRGIPTFIVADSGKNEIARIVGYRSPVQLIENLREEARTSTVKEPTSKDNEQVKRSTLYAVFIPVIIIATVLLVLAGKRLRRKKE
jgi:thioredoxin-related protein